MSSPLPIRATDRGVRVLSLDGGGAGALTELLILERMMYRTKIEGGLDKIPSPCDYFEVIGGTGTGGVIALMLGRLRMSVADAIKAYETLTPQYKIIGFTREFDASKFEKSLKDIIKTEIMIDLAHDACKTFVCAMNGRNMTAGIPELFRSYDTPEEPANDCMIWEAARATSAIPGLFKPMEIRQGRLTQLYIDGGFGNNNPTSLALEEAKQLYPRQSVVLVVSIGSGHPDTIQSPKSPSSSAIANVAKGIATDSERTHEENARRFRRSPNTYFRFNVEQGMQGLSALDWGKSTEVTAYTRAYLSLAETKSKVTATVEVILNPVVLISISPGHVKLCPPPTFRFTGRENILRTMFEYFNDGRRRRHIFLLHGLGGTGKSQIAFKFVECSAIPEPRFSETYFVDSSSEQTIETDLVSLALAKKIGRSAQDTIRWLAHQRNEWLIIFNNADDIHLNLMRYIPSGTHGNILITSRNPELSQHAEAEHKVECMEVEEATDLLLSVARYGLGAAENREIGRRLVQKLHCLPLAVAQAGAYISSSRALPKYLSLYESTAKRIQLLHEKPQQSDYESSVYTTWQISFEKVSTQAAKLLQLCSFIHHDGIIEEIFQYAASYSLTPEGPREDELREPLDFLAGFLETSGSQWDSTKFIDTTRELGAYSLIEFQAAWSTISFSIHPLIHEWCRTTVKLDTAANICIHKLLGMSLSSAGDNFRFSHLVFPHLDALLFRTAEDSGRKPTVLDMTFARQCLHVYLREGKWDTGVELGSSMLEIATSQGTELRTLGIQGALAALYMERGDLNLASGLEEFVIQRRTDLLGRDHSSTLDAMGDLAITYSKLGRFKEAEQLEIVILNKRKEILGEDHPDTLRTMANLAVRYAELGQLSRAAELGVMILNKQRNIYGEGHPKTLPTMANLAARYSELGQFKEGEKLQEVVMNKYKKLWGDEHPETLNAMSNLAATYWHEGNFTHAESLQTTVLTKWKDITYDDHPMVLVAMGNLAETYSQLGKLDQAEEMLRATMVKRRNILGEGHAHTIYAEHTLAEMYQQQGKWFDAERLQVVRLARLRLSTDPNQQNILVGMGQLARTYCRKGYLEQAQILQVTSCEELERRLDPSHPNILEIKLHLSMTLREQGKLAKAEKLGADVVKCMVGSEALGANHPTTLRAQAELATTYHQIGRLESAVILATEVAEKQRKFLGEEHPESLRTMASLKLTTQELTPSMYVRDDARLTFGPEEQGGDLPPLSIVRPNSRPLHSRLQTPELSRTLVYIVMQCKIFAAFVLSFMTLAASAAPVPVPDLSKGLHLLDREIEHAAFVGMSEVARAPEPEPEAEARGCKMYTCF
ncbi:hypothetical protein DFH09DRAFT_1362342 [Mycena vulgaris]|nr:hypothetical protein DFH09DRAFT_1362342 [Mycena vulgaris]